jgi:hypothetical protein
VLRGFRTLVLALAIALSFVSLAARARKDAQGPIRFSFTGGGLAGWVATSGRLEASGEGARLEVRDDLSAFLSPAGLAVDVSYIKRLDVDLRVDPPGAGALLYWTDDAGKGFVPEWRVSLHDGRNLIDLSETGAWSGTIDRFLIAPGKGATSATLRLFEVRAARGAAEKGNDLARRFFETELRSQYSVNGILGAYVGPVPFSLLLGLLFAALPLLAALAGPRALRAPAARLLPSMILSGSLLFLARASCDEARIAGADTAALSGKSLEEKLAATNPPGFYALLAEARRKVPAGAPVELRAPKPYPWEKGGYYLYPSRIVDRAEYVVTYRASAPADSAASDLLLRMPGTGTVYKRRPE